MPNTKVSSMTALTGADTASSDLLPIIDVSETGAAKNKSITRDQLRLAMSGEVLAADFVTTIASASTLETIFTPVPCTSGKTYHFEVDFWIQWATAAASGDAISGSSVAVGTPTVGANRMLFWIDGTLGNGGANDALNSTNALITALASPTHFRAAGFFTATSSDNFNWGLIIAAWDAGDVVTVFKGAKFLVQQVD